MPPRARRISALLAKLALAKREMPKSAAFLFSAAFLRVEEEAELVASVHLHCSVLEYFALLSIAFLSIALFRLFKNGYLHKYSTNRF